MSEDKSPESLSKYSLSQKGGWVKSLTIDCEGCRFYEHRKTEVNKKLSQFIGVPSKSYDHFCYWNDDVKVLKNRENARTERCWLDLDCSPRFRDLEVGAESKAGLEGFVEDIDSD